MACMPSSNVTRGWKAMKIQHVRGRSHANIQSDLRPVFLTLYRRLAAYVICLSLSIYTRIYFVLFHVYPSPWHLHCQRPAQPSPSPGIIGGKKFHGKVLDQPGKARSRVQIRGLIFSAYKKRRISPSNRNSKTDFVFKTTHVWIHGYGSSYP